MNCLLAHPTGNNFVRQAAIALLEAKALREFHLSIASSGNNSFSRLTSIPGFGEIARRSYPAELQQLLHLHPVLEICRLLATRLGYEAPVKHEAGWASLDACCRYFDQKVAQRLKQQSRIDSVYAYEDSALQTFRVAEQRGLRRIYDLPIAHWNVSRRIMEEEAERLPAWRPTLTAVFDSAEKCARKDEELALADCVICPSQFVADSLPTEAVVGKQVAIIPFGSPTVTQSKRTTNRDEKLRVLFVGSMSQRKGLGDLMNAMKLLDPEKFELHVMGSLLAPMDFYRKQYPSFIYHAPRPHDQVLELMQSCDVFALPSLVEGRALVQQEALACGLPIIVTANAGAEDLVDDNKAGFLVPIRSSEAIAQRLTQLQESPDLLVAMQAAAPVKAAEVSWTNYRSGIVSAAQAT